MKGVRVGIKAGSSDRALTQWQRKEPLQTSSQFCAYSKSAAGGNAFRVLCEEGARGKPEEAMEGYTCDANTGRQTPALPSFMLSRKTVRFMGARL